MTDTGLTALERDFPCVRLWIEPKEIIRQAGI